MSLDNSLFSRPNFWIPAIIKIFAIYAFYVHLGMNTFVATILAVVFCFVPIVSEGLFIAGAIYGWHIEWYYAVIILIVISGFRYRGIYW
ncbi:hypothetical protein EXB91_24765 [Salmonella enterica subsp. enterica serovar Florida]|uniref:Uncharacterized protein n=3 Tax=Salmonella enterica I TaxID=59201 RepID=A0A5U8JIT4_SALET|nr:hypothetical protein [Salmonella enterica]EBR7996904.1 hypothetical protein [Salmonella enterica subsp. enterica serovar Panama]EBS4088749.1 hypothetical protein [Salmonella enterica subsp. enterica serovar Newport]ECG3786838.1 hypothetical protein [Salmonella enterica subsp. enterica serovar Florida]ASD87216.1 hypothetical protein LFZ16_13805 [Salmonella enterica subsp. enterica serovar India str. SA20085604]EBR8436481.1 hypothetical protein [Salmonella enterica subsp. enterica serovar Pan